MNIDNLTLREELRTKRINRMEAIREIAIFNKVPFLDVLEIYSKFNSRVYADSVKKKEKFLLYNPILEGRTYDLTDRYFKIHKQIK